MQKTFDKQAYLTRKRREKRSAWFFLILGGIILLDSGSPFPIPLVGMPSIVIGMIVMGYGFYQLQIFQQLPLHEALLLGRQQGGTLTRTDIFLQLELTPEQTDQLIQSLIHEGFIEPIDTGLPPQAEIGYRLIS